MHSFGEYQGASEYSGSYGFFFREISLPYDNTSVGWVMHCSPVCPSTGIVLEERFPSVRTQKYMLGK